MPSLSTTHSRRTGDIYTHTVLKTVAQVNAYKSIWSIWGTGGKVRDTGKKKKKKKKKSSLLYNKVIYLNLYQKKKKVFPFKYSQDVLTF